MFQRESSTAMYDSYDQLRKARKMQSEASLRRTASGASLSSMGSLSSIATKASQWDHHVRMTAMRNERIRLQNEASRLRGAFVNHDKRLTGEIPRHMLKPCLKAGGSQLPDNEVAMLAKRFATSDGGFHWLRFCESLETGRGDQMANYHPRVFSRPSTAQIQENAMVPNKELYQRGGTVSSKFLASKMSRRSMTPSASMGMLTGSISSLDPQSGKVSRMRRMVSQGSAASLRTSESAAKLREEKFNKMAEWQSNFSAKSRPSTVPANMMRGPAPPTPQEAPPSVTYAEPEPAYVPPPPPADGLTHEERFQRDKEIKSLMAMAEEGLNSRFSDMFKAFQYVDLDRSGRLSKKEIQRALDLWNITITEDQLDMILGNIDEDNDGGISYEEFVDKLARGTVAPAAMGKRGMQSKEAMGVDSQEMLAKQLGHGDKKYFDPSINAKGGVSSTKPGAKVAVKPPTPQVAAAPPAKKALTHEEKFQQEKEIKSLMAMAEEGMNSRFSDMFKAFQYVDLDRSGRLSKKELQRALDLWNIPISDEQLDMILGNIDEDNDGGISYEEFVDKLARGTVAPAAMGKRGMQSKEAMGVDSQEMLAKQLGHGDKKYFDPSINAKGGVSSTKPGAKVAVKPPTPQVAAAPPAKKALTHEEKFQQEKEIKSLMAMAEEGMNSRFSDMFKAFQYVDLDRSGRLSKQELRRALDLWNIPISDEQLDMILGTMDDDDDGGISYEEFVDKLARGTVAPAAMGKRGMQSKEAMGVDSQEMLAKQLGHGDKKYFNPSINA